MSLRVRVLDSEEAWKNGAALTGSTVEEVGFGFRLRAHGPAGLTYRSDDKNAQPRRYLIGERDEIQLLLTFDDLEYRSTLVAVGYPYASDDEARGTGTRMVQALRLAGWDHRTALDLGTPRPTGTQLSDHAVDEVFRKTQSTMVGDAHGLTTFRYLGGDVLAIRGSARAHSPRDEDEFVGLVDMNFSEGRSLDDKTALAVDLYAQSHLGSSILGGFVTKVACLEICAHQKSLGTTADRLVDEFIVHAKTLSASSEDEQVKSEVESIVGRLGTLRRESIASSIIQLADRAGFSEADIHHVAPSVAALVRSVYEARSRIVHSGGDPVELGVPDLASDLEALVRKLIQYRIDHDPEGR